MRQGNTVWEESEERNNEIRTSEKVVAGETSPSGTGAYACKIAVPNVPERTAIEFLMEPVFDRELTERSSPDLIPQWPKNRNDRTSNVYRHTASAVFRHWRSSGKKCTRYKVPLVSEGRRRNRVEIFFMHPAIIGANHDLVTLDKKKSYEIFWPRDRSGRISAVFFHWLPAGNRTRRKRLVIIQDHKGKITYWYLDSNLIYSSNVSIICRISTICSEIFWFKQEYLRILSWLVIITNG